MPIDPAIKYTGKLSTRIKWRAPDGVDPFEFGEPPRIENWRILRDFWFRYPALRGDIFGHPLLGDWKDAHTSAIVWISVETGFARTVSRYYRLGRRFPGSKLREFSESPLQLIAITRD